MKSFSPFGVPLINTFILLTSGLTVTVSHVSIVSWEEKFHPTSLDAFTLMDYHYLIDTVQPVDYYHNIIDKNSLF